LITLGRLGFFVKLAVSEPVTVRFSGEAFRPIMVSWLIGVNVAVDGNDVIGAAATVRNAEGSLLHGVFGTHSHRETSKGLVPGISRHVPGLALFAVQAAPSLAQLKLIVVQVPCWVDARGGNRSPAIVRIAKPEERPPFIDFLLARIIHPITSDFFIALNPTQRLTGMTLRISHP
jgi:hypothetical protein